MTKLGKGLSALISDEPDVNERLLKLSQIRPGKFQHRNDFAEDKLHELAESIKSNGVVQPILVRKSDEGYDLIAGERRWRASAIAGLDQIPVVILEADDKTALQVSIIENIQRDDFNLIEEAQGYKHLLDEFSYTQEELSKVVGKSRSHITNCLRILTLPETIQNMIIAKRLTMGHARALIGIDDNIDIAEQIIKKELNVRQVEDLIKKRKKPEKTEAKDEDIILLEKTLSAKIGVNLKVQINDNKKNGSVIMRFNNLDELRCILDKLKALIK